VSFWFGGYLIDMDGVIYRENPREFCKASRTSRKRSGPARPPIASPALCSRTQARTAAGSATVTRRTFLHSTSRDLALPWPS